MLPAFFEALSQRDFVSAIRLARSEIEARPNDASAHHALGMALQGQGDNDAARDAYLKAISLSPERSVFQLSLATLDLNQKRLDEAEDSYRSVTKVDPNNLEAYVGLVHIALARGENDKAAQYLKFAQRINESHPSVLIGRAHVAQFNGQLDEAIRLLTVAVEAVPNHVLAQASLGMAYLKKGHYAFAEQALSNANQMQPNNYGIAHSLVEALRMQNKVPELLKTLDEVLLRHPHQQSMRSLRADVRLATGNANAALEDYLQLLELNPGHPQLLAILSRVFSARNEKAQAIAYVENALQFNPKQELNWNLRLSLAGEDYEDAGNVLTRWRDTLPESSLAKEAHANYFEMTGHQDKAEQLADEVLAEAEIAGISSLIKVRAELRRDPKLAVNRLNKLEPYAQTADAQRRVYTWRGVAQHMLGNYVDAGKDFRQMLQRPVQLHHLPQLFDADEQQTGQGTGYVLWAPCGFRAEPVLNALAPCLSNRLLAERDTQLARNDGFGFYRLQPGSEGPNGEKSGSAQSWREAIQAFNMDPETAVDWQPHWDGYTANALKGTHLVALMMDPRDAFLNWIVYGSVHPYNVYPQTEINASWLAKVYEAVANSIEAADQNVTVCVVDNIAEDADLVSKQLKAALKLEELPNAQIIGAPVQTIAGFSLKFPAGTWRNYSATFGKEFEILTPVAVRLGYSAQ